MDNEQNQRSSRSRSRRRRRNRSSNAASSGQQQQQQHPRPLPGDIQPDTSDPRLMHPNLGGRPGRAGRPAESQPMSEAQLMRREQARGNVADSAEPRQADAQGNRRRRQRHGQGQQQNQRQSPKQGQATQHQANTNRAAEKPSEQRQQSSGNARQGGNRRSRSGGGSERRPPVSASQTSGNRRGRRPRRDFEVSDRRLIAPRTTLAAHGAVVGPIGEDTVRVIPLGGVGEVGKNMSAVECGRDIVLLDAGGKFPEEEQRGIDLIIPDISFILERKRNFRGILLTHGHEDHIGGLPYIVPQIADERNKVPIYGTPLALGFVERKLAEARLDDMVELHTVQDGSRVRLGCIEAEFIHVTHSIPDACAIAVHTPVGTLVDTGDFKFDPTPVMGGPTNERLLKRIGDKGVMALFSDTVRVETEGSTPSEKVVHEKLEQEIASAQGQVIIATFASNVSRVHMALHAAEKHGRKVAVAGRSMEQNTRVAMDLGYLEPPDGLFVSLEELLHLPKEKRVIVSTGSQGEPSAALSRIAAGEHPKIRVGRGDKVIVSATPIPGNEETVTNTINNLYRLGVDVVYSALDRGVHVSGHAGRDELARMIELLRPTWAVPIHGEFRHMALYRDLCTKHGVRRDHVLLPEIGGVIEFTANSAAQKGRVRSGNILVDRLGERGSMGTVLRTRENLTEHGFVVVTMIVDRGTGDLVAGPYLVGKGLAGELNNGSLKEAENELRRLLERRKEASPQLGYVVQRAKETVGKVLYRRSKTRPLILPIVTEL